MHVWSKKAGALLVPQGTFNFPLQQNKWHKCYTPLGVSAHMESDQGSYFTGHVEMIPWLMEIWPARKTKPKGQLNILGRTQMFPQSIMTPSTHTFCSCWPTQQTWCNKSFYKLNTNATNCRWKQARPRGTQTSCPADAASNQHSTPTPKDTVSQRCILQCFHLPCSTCLYAVSSGEYLTPAPID